MTLRSHHFQFRSAELISDLQNGSVNDPEKVERLIEYEKK